MESPLVTGDDCDFVSVAYLRAKHDAIDSSQTTVEVRRVQRLSGKTLRPSVKKNPPAQRAGGFIHTGWRTSFELIATSKNVHV
jgi:hypothetical protein